MCSTRAALLTGPPTHHTISSVVKLLFTTIIHHNSQFVQVAFFFDQWLQDLHVQDTWPASSDHHVVITQTLAPQSHLGTFNSLIKLHVRLFLCLSQSFLCHCPGLSHHETCNCYYHCHSHNTLAIVQNPSTIAIQITIAIIIISISIVEDFPTMTILPGHGPVLSSEAGRALASNYLDTTSGHCHKVSSRWWGLS